MNLTKKVAFNTGVQIIGRVITTLISLVLVVALTRYLGVSGYGQYTIIFAFVGFFGVLADFGFFWILIREIAHPEADTDKITSNILTLRTLIGVIFYGLAFLIALFIPQYHGFRFGIGIIALASLFQTLNLTYVGIFQNKLRMDKAVLTDILGRLIILGLTLYLIKQNYSLSLILWAYVAGNIINFLASAWLGRVYIKFRPAFDYQIWKKIFVQVLPIGILMVLGMIYFKVDSVMLSLMRTSEDVGIYGPPYKVLEILLTFPGIFMGNIFPIVTRYIHEKDERLQGVIQKSFDFLFLLAIPVVLGVIFTAPRIIEIVAGPTFMTAHTIGPVFGIPATSSLALQILIIAAGFSFISNMFGYLVIALGKQAQMIKLYLILVVVNVGLNLILIPKISYIGAAMATVVTEILVLLFSWYVAHRYINLRFKLAIIWKSLLSGLVLSVFLYFCGPSLNILILIVLSGVIYGIVLYLLGGINKEILNGLIKRG